MKKALLLDLDGTVTNSLGLISRTYKKVFDEMGIPWQDQEVMKYIGIPLREIGRTFAGVNRVEEFYTSYQNYYKREHDAFMECYPDAVEVILAAKERGFVIGIVTSKSRRGTVLTLEFLKLTQFMDVIITADDVDEHKPHPMPVLKALEILNIKPSNAVFVGDSPFDILSGQAAKVTTIGVTWGMASEELILQHKPDYVVHSWRQLEELILNDTFGK